MRNMLRKSVTVVFFLIFFSPNFAQGNFLDDVRHGAEETAKGAGETVSNAGKAVEQTVQETGKTAEKAVQDTGKTAEKAAQDTGRTIEKAGQDTGRTIEKAGQDTGRTIEKAAQDVGNTIEKAGQDTGRTIEKAGQDTEAEARRAGKNLEEAAHAIGKYMERSVQGTGRTLSSAERRVREGKVVDAMWHLATEHLQESENSAAKATQESSIIRTVGQVAASAYGGPAGAAAYASWYTYRETGDADLALRVGIITGVTSTAFAAAGKMPSETTDELAKKAVVTGAIGGLAVAASGGDEKAIKEGFFLAGGMVIVQDGYKRFTKSDLDARSSQGEAYCMASVGEECSPPGSAYIRDANGDIQYDSSGRPLVDVTKTDPHRPHVGNWSKKSEASWNHERGKFMTSVSRIPGMNAMSVFHDQWAVSWDMNALTTVGTIAPAIVLTYTGTGTQYYELLRKTAVEKGRTVSASHEAITTVQLSPTNSAVSVNANMARQSTYKDRNLRAVSSEIVESSYICAKKQKSRSIIVEGSSPKKYFACRVLYLSEKANSVIWWALYNKNFCAPKSRSLVEKQVRMGWSCFSR